MGGEDIAPKIRERVWVTKIDMSGKEPVPIEEILIENGQLVYQRSLPREDQGD